MSRQVTKLDHFSGSFSATSRVASFSIIGPKDNVRIAARDAVYGLGIPADCEHVTEEVKMGGRPAFVLQKLGQEEEQAQIDIRVSIANFDNLVLMFRYCLQVGVPMMQPQDYYMWSDEKGCTYESAYLKDGEEIRTLSTLGGYLAAARAAAECNMEPLVIEKDVLPANRNFWTQAELDADEAARKQNYQASKQGIFKNVADPIERRKQEINLKLEKIYDEAAILTDRHPANPNNYSLRITARSFIWQYKDVKKRHPDMDFLSSHWMIRPEDCDKFIALAEKYERLNDELKALNELTRPKEDASFLGKFQGIFNL